jgi:hypothetical protein
MESISRYGRVVTRTAFSTLSNDGLTSDDLYERSIGESLFRMLDWDLHRGRLADSLLASNTLPAQRTAGSWSARARLSGATVIPQPNDYFDLDQGLPGALWERSLERLIWITVGGAT